MEPSTAKHSSATGGWQSVYCAGIIAGTLHESSRHIQFGNYYFGIGLQFGFAKKWLSLAEATFRNASRWIYTPYVSTIETIKLIDGDCIINFCSFHSIELTVLSIDLQNIIKWMLDPDPFKRPDVNAILATDKIRKILARRQMVRPFIKIVSDPWLLSGTRLFSSRYFYGFWLLIAEEGIEKCMELNVYVPDIHLQFAHVNYGCAEIDAETWLPKGVHCSNIDAANSGRRFVGRFISATGRFKHRFRWLAQQSKPEQVVLETDGNANCQFDAVKPLQFAWKLSTQSQRTVAYKLSVSYWVPRCQRCGSPSQQMINFFRFLFTVSVTMRTSAIAAAVQQIGDSMATIRTTIVKLCRT